MDYPISAATVETLIPPNGLGDESYGRFSTGILPSHVLKRLLDQGREVTASEPFAPGQIQPASIDLRLGAVAYRVRASFLPGPAATVADKLKTAVVPLAEARSPRRRFALPGGRLLVPQVMNPARAGDVAGNRRVAVITDRAAAADAARQVVLDPKRGPARPADPRLGLVAA